MYCLQATGLFTTQNALLDPVAPQGAHFLYPFPQGGAGVGGTGGGGGRARVATEFDDTDGTGYDIKGNSASETKLGAANSRLKKRQVAARKGGCRWGDLEGRTGAPSQREPD